MGQVVSSHECEDEDRARERKRRQFALRHRLDARRIQAHNTAAANQHTNALRRLITQLAGSVIDGGKLDKVRKLAAKTPPGDERAVAWCMYDPTQDTTFSVIKICAKLGRLDEMNAILEAWSERRPNGAEIVASLVDDADWSLTPLMIAVHVNRPDIAECLINRWHADPTCSRSCTEWGPSWGGHASVLHICQWVDDFDSARLILSSSCSVERRVLLFNSVHAARNLGGSSSSRQLTPLEMAIQASRFAWVKFLADSKWGMQVTQAMESRKPISFCATSGCRSVEILAFLCEVFDSGMAEAFVHSLSYTPEFASFLMRHSKFPQCINNLCSSCNDKGQQTALVAAILNESHHDEFASELLSLGADPNTPCTVCPKWCHFPPEMRTPLTMAVALNRKKVVAEMVKRGGILPSGFSEFWSNRDPNFTVESFLEGTWDKHVQARAEYERLLPPSQPFSELRSSMAIADTTPLSCTYTCIPIDHSLTSLMVRYQSEITGVLELLDIRSLGRIQQTSRFWYHVGRTNSLWKNALVNTSTTWSPQVRQTLAAALLVLCEARDTPPTKWKRVCFFWVSRNLCARCHRTYREYQGKQCYTGSGKHVPTTTDHIEGT
ncbi:hypothetical protein Pelo_17892 [Pelomyxa schiedti]|nr:hypothetical protein Pelo_17892 [Pelomyxa schiedti]